LIPAAVLDQRGNIASTAQGNESLKYFQQTPACIIRGRETIRLAPLRAAMACSAGNRQWIGESASARLERADVGCRRLDRAEAREEPQLRCRPAGGLSDGAGAALDIVKEKLQIDVNGDLVHKNILVTWTPAVAADADSAGPVELRAGENRLLVEVSNAGGEWGLYLRLEDPEGRKLRLTDEGRLEPLDVP
jgi:hypothetical protein